MRINLIAFKENYKTVVEILVIDVLDRDLVRCRVKDREDHRNGMIVIALLVALVVVMIVRENREDALDRREERHVMSHREDHRVSVQDDRFREINGKSLNFSLMFFQSFNYPLFLQC